MDEYITNNNGIRFKVCCASCTNRLLEVTGSRCGLSRAKPKDGERCGSFQFRPGLMDAGKEKGRIKKAHYFRYLMEWRDREKASNGKIVPAGLAQIHSEYEKQYGSMYLTP